MAEVDYPQEIIVQIYRLIDATLADVALAFDHSSYQRGRIVGKLSAVKGNLAMLQVEVRQLQAKERMYDSL